MRPESVVPEINSEIRETKDLLKAMLFDYSLICSFQRF